MPSRRSDPKDEPTGAVNVRGFPGERINRSGFDANPPERAWSSRANDRASQCGGGSPPRGERPGVGRFNRSGQHPGVSGENESTGAETSSRPKAGVVFLLCSLDNQA